MTSDEDRACRIAEDRVAGRRAATAGYMVLAAVGIVVLAATNALDAPVLLHVVVWLAGGAAIGLGLDSVGRLRGQREALRWWRDSLTRPAPPDNPPA